jgi:hypothetical protein
MFGVSCTDATAQGSDSGLAPFRVTGSDPVDGSTDVPDSKVPELRFSAAANQSVCFEGQLSLEAISEDDTVAFDIDYSLSFLEGGFKVQFQTDQALRRGYWYAMVARDDEGRPCVDDFDNPLEPAGVKFYVP